MPIHGLPPTSPLGSTTLGAAPSAAPPPGAGAGVGSSSDGLVTPGSGAPLGPLPASVPAPGTFGGVSTTHAGVVGAMTWSPTPYSLPSHVGLGVATIHRYTDTRVTPSTIAITVFTPVSTPEFPSTVLDLTARKHHEILPERCIIGDAGLTRAFLGIDKREGTPLDQKLDAIEAELPKKADGTIDPEAAIQFVRVRTNQLIAWTAGSSYNDGRAEFPWDKAIKVDPSAWDTFKSAAYQPVGELPYLTGQTFPVVPLEKYLDAGQGYCIQKALLASLILERAGVHHRIANGAVSKSAGVSTGHTWIELADGRILDPAWKQIGTPETTNAPVPGFFKFGGSWRFENQTFPYLRD